MPLDQSQESGRTGHHHRPDSSGQKIVADQSEKSESSESHQSGHHCPCRCRIEIEEIEEAPHSARARSRAIAVHWQRIRLQ